MKDKMKDGKKGCSTDPGTYKTSGDSKKTKAPANKKNGPNKAGPYEKGKK